MSSSPQVSTVPFSDVTTKQSAAPPNLKVSWLGRHACWVNKKIHSNINSERIFAKIWAVVFQVLLGISLIFIPQAIKFRNYLNQSAKQTPLDTPNFAMDETWRREMFLNRARLPLLTDVEREKIESRYQDKLPEIRNSVEKLINQSDLAITDEKKQAMIEVISKHYFLTLQYYSPAIAHWIDWVLEKAAADNKKIVFLARDGIVFNDVAKTLLQKDPAKYQNYSPDNLSIAWLSRKSAESVGKRGDLLQRYFKQLGIEENDKVMIVDTGCTGSIKPLLAPHLKNDLEWQFSVSRNSVINGYWDNADFSLQALAFITTLPSDHPDAWANNPKSANNWLEDTHRGNSIRAEKFVDDKEHGIIYPVPSMELVQEGGGNRLITKEIKAKDIEELQSILIRDYGFKAIVDYTKESTSTKNTSYDEIKRNLNDFLTRIQKREIVIPCLHD